MSAKTSIFDKQKALISGLTTNKHPIIRLFCRGVSKDQKYASVLIDVHGFYPYFFCQIPDEVAVKITDLNAFKRELAGQLEMLTHEMFPKINQRINSVIHDIMFVKAIPFNGYQKTKRLFAKILVSEQFVMHSVIQTIVQAPQFSKYYIFESTISTFTKFVHDCKIDLNKPVKFSSCIARTSEICNKISSCDYEFDAHFSLIAQDQNLEQQNQTQQFSQYDSELVQNITQQLQELYHQRVTLNSSQQLNSFLDDQINVEGENNEESSYSQEKSNETEEEGSDPNKHLETDVQWFEQQFDIVNPAMKLQTAPQESATEISITSLSAYNINVPFKKLHYGNINDIPTKPFTHIGRVFDWKSEQTNDISLNDNIYSQEVLNKPINKLISEQYGINIINEEQNITCQQNQIPFSFPKENANSPSPRSPTSPTSETQHFDNTFNQIKNDAENLLNKYERLSYVYKICHVEVSQLDMFVIVQSFALHAGTLIDMIGQTNSQNLQLNNLINSQYYNIQQFSRFDVFINTDKVPSNQIKDIKQQIYRIMYRAMFEQNDADVHHDNDNIITNIQRYYQFNNVYFEYCPLKEIITIKFPECIHLIDPDFITNFSNEYSGIGRLIQLGFLLYNINLMRLLDKQINRQQLQIIKSNKNTNKIEKQLGKHLLVHGSYTHKLNVYGRTILSLQLYLQNKVRCSDYRLETLLKKFGISQFYVAKQHKQVYLQAMQLPEMGQCKASHETNQSVTHNINESLTLQFGNSYDIPIYGNQFILQYQDVASEMISNALHAVQLLITSNVITSIHYSAGINNIVVKDSLERGSQFRVEQFLLSEARKNDFLLGPIPTSAQIAQMKPNSITPILFEPQTKFYDFPMLVFDFASLYPSILSEFNLCYTTLLCNFEKKQQIAALPIYFVQSDFKNIKQDDLFKSAMNCIFVKKPVRKGIIPTIIDQALEQRAKINGEIKIIKQQKSKLLEIKKIILSRKTQNLKRFQNVDINALNDLIQKLDSIYSSLDGKQMTYKLFLNTIYGYAAGQFSGHMPCQFISDTVIDIANKLVMYSIKIIERDYQCNVVYADTDSLFLDTSKHFINKSNMTRLQMLQEASDFGSIILNKLNSMFNKPIRLKFEKIYFPSILYTKKKYAGLSYDYDVAQSIQGKQWINIQPQMDIKGLEQMKKDIPLVSKYFLYKTLEILFLTQDLSQLQQFILSYILKFSLESIDAQYYAFNRATNKNINKNKIINEIYQQKDPQGDHVQFVIIKSVSDAKKQVTAGSFIHLRDIWQLNENGTMRYTIYYLYYIQRLMIDVANNIYGACGYDIYAAISQLSHFVLENQQQLLQNYVQDTEKFSQILQYFIKHQSSMYAYNKDRIYKIFNILNLKLSSSRLLPSVKKVVRIPMLSSYVKCIQNQEIKSTSKQCFLCQNMQTSTIENGYICDTCIKNYSINKVLKQFLRTKQSLWFKMRQFSNRQKYCANCSLTQSIACCNYECSVFHQKNKLRAEILILSNQFAFLKSLLSQSIKLPTQSQNSDIELLSQSVEGSEEAEEQSYELSASADIIEISD